MDSREDKKGKHLPAELVYESIREEILDQKKCQFQFFVAATTVTIGTLGYGVVNNTTNNAIYLFPILLNAVALVVILDKAISYQRKVGYLKFMERGFDKKDWKWETHLEAFRTKEVKKKEYNLNERRKHSYVTSIFWMLTIQSLVSTGLCIAGMDGELITNNWGPIQSISIVFLLAGIGFGLFKRYSLITGENSSPAIEAKWEKVFSADEPTNSRQ